MAKLKPLIPTFLTAREHGVQDTYFVEAFRHNNFDRTSGPIRLGQKFNLAKYVHDFDPEQHHVDPALQLARVYVKIEGQAEPKVIDVSRMITSNFIGRNDGGNYSTLWLDFRGLCFYQAAAGTNATFSLQMSGSFNLVTNEVELQGPKDLSGLPAGWTIMGAELDAKFCETPPKVTPDAIEVRKWIDVDTTVKLADLIEGFRPGVDTFEANIKLEQLRVRVEGEDADRELNVSGMPCVYFTRHPNYNAESDYNEAFGYSKYQLDFKDTVTVVPDPSWRTEGLKAEVQITGDFSVHQGELFLACLSNPHELEDEGEPKVHQVEVRFFYNSPSVLI